MNEITNKKEPPFNDVLLRKKFALAFVVVAAVVTVASSDHIRERNKAIKSSVEGKGVGDSCFFEGAHTQTGESSERDFLLASKKTKNIIIIQNSSLITSLRKEERIFKTFGWSRS